jgi:polysaccharide export outer membrane protein
MMSRLRLSALSGLFGLAALPGCMGDVLPQQSPDFPTISYSNWRSQDGAYRFYPGDTFRIDVRTAPELSGELTIAPDGTIALPTIGPVTASGRTVRELQNQIEEIYANELRDPSLVITPTGFGSQKIFVGGEVKHAGAFDLPGEIDVLQAIMLAGGWTDAAKPSHVIIMRRGPGGELMTRVVDARSGQNRRGLGDIGPLQRFDVIYVTRTAIAEQNLFVKQWIRDALPFDFTLFYDIARF